MPCCPHKAGGCSRVLQTFNRSCKIPELSQTFKTLHEPIYLHEKHKRRKLSSIKHNPICQTRFVYKQSAQLGSFWSFTYSAFRIKGMILPPSNTKITTLIFFVKITHTYQKKKKKKKLFSTNMENNSIVKWKKKRKKGLFLSCKRLEISLDF